MKILKEDGKYKVESSSTKGKFYIVDLSKGSCTCPAFIFRKKCKHIPAVEEFANKQTGSKEFNEVLAYVAEKKEVDSIELIEKFGLDRVDALISRGELIEDKGKIRVLK